MKHDERIKLRSGLEVSRVALGAAAFGGLYKSVTDQACTQTLHTALNHGITYLDTAPHYGKGTSERRLGASIKGFDRSKMVISTKVGRVLNPSTTDFDGLFLDADNTVERKLDFSASAVRRSLEESLVRLGIDSVDILYIHDPDDYADIAIREAYPELEKMRDEGIIKSIGIGMNQCEIPTRFVKETDIDLVLIAGRYSLLDQQAALELLPAALERGVDVVVAGVFNSGILANPTKGASFDYMPASDEIINRAIDIREVLDGHGVSLTGAAMQFPFQHPAVKAVLIGCRSQEEVLSNIAAFDKTIDSKVWDDLAKIS